MRWRRGIFAVCVAVSCGAPQRAEIPSPYRVKVYRPLGSKADAKVTNQAVILGTDATDGSTLIPLAATGGKVAVDATFLATKDARDTSAGIAAVTLQVAPNRDGTARVDLVGTNAGDTGSKWHANVWIAALAATTALNKDLTDFTFAATSTAYIDGASASGLIAVGFLAAFTGAPIDPNTTLIGTINPDGTIGPVDGIPEQLAAAIAKGKKRIGVPIGMRYAKSEQLQRATDLVELAAARHAELVEIGDIHQAYFLMTGTHLPEPVEVSDADMALDAKSNQVLDAQYKQWQQRLAAEWGAILQLESAGRLPAILVTLRDNSKRYAEAAAQLHEEHKLAAAYARVLAATVYAASANRIYDVLRSVQTNQLDVAIAALDQLDKLGAQPRAMLLEVGALHPTTMGGHLEVLAAFRAALSGLAFKDFAAVALANTKAYLASFVGTPAATLGADKTADAVVAQVGPTVLYVWKTIAETTAATEQLELTTTSDINYTCSVPDALRLATSLGSAAAASIGYFDAAVVEPFARNATLDLDHARTRIAIAEPDYLVAATAKRATRDSTLDELAAQWGEHSTPWSLLSLARSELAYFHTTELIAKYDSLAIEIADAGHVSHLERAKAFAAMLDSAQRTARATARAARVATGTIPVQARLAYQLAMASRNGSLADQVDALGQFWAASGYSQTAVMLARN